MHREAVSDQAGKAAISPDIPVETGSRGTWTITYTASAVGVEIGGKVRITIPHGFTAPQTKAFFDPGFTTVSTSADDVELSLDVVSDIFCRLDEATGHSGAWGRSVFVTVEGRSLKIGESFSLVYGNADYYGCEAFGKAGACARELSGPAEFTVAVDPDGTRSAPYSGFTQITEQPTLEILPGMPVACRAIAPSDAVGGGACEVTLVSTDTFNNVVRAEMRTTPLPEGEIVRLELEEGGECVKSNPIRVYDNPVPLKVFWGDIHGHTRHSDGLGSVDDYYRFARESASLDFAAITDHDDIGPRLSDDEWQTISRAAEDANDPPRFVSLLGYEYRNGLCDMNVYYPDEEGELLRGSDGEWSSASELTRRIKRAGGMIIPHMHFGADSSGFDSDVYRVIEIYSQHGSAECPGCPREIPYLRRQLQKSSRSNTDAYVQNALASGHRLGFTAGSDTHCARPGLSNWTRVCRTYQGGLTAVFAADLTRDSIWDALHRRRCYATTGNRSLLEFSVNGGTMGSEISVPEGQARTLLVVCHADGALRRLTVFRSGERWIEEEISGDTVERSFEDESRTEADWYYVRIDLAGGEMVWSSPVWVDVG